MYVESFRKTGVNFINPRKPYMCITLIFSNIKAFTLIIALSLSIQSNSTDTPPPPPLKRNCKSYVLLIIREFCSWLQYCFACGIPEVTLKNGTVLANGCSFAFYLRSHSLKYGWENRLSRVRFSWFSSVTLCPRADTFCSHVLVDFLSLVFPLFDAVNDLNRL
jgi:hypothetical protein